MDRASRKQHLRDYKNTPPARGVFAIRNLVNGRLLIGSSEHLPGSLNRHRTELRLGTHRCKALQQDWQTHGEAQFAFEVLEQLRERAEPGYDYAAELAARLAFWQSERLRSDAVSYR